MRNTTAGGQNLHFRRSGVMWLKSALQQGSSRSTEFDLNALHSYCIEVSGVADMPLKQTTDLMKRAAKANYRYAQYFMGMCFITGSLTKRFPLALFVAGKERTNSGKEMTPELVPVCHASFCADLREEFWKGWLNLSTLDYNFIGWSIAVFWA